MFLYQAVYSNGVAKIIEVKTGREAVVQPFKPTDIGSVPWESEEEALYWLRTQHEGFLILQEIDDKVQEENQ